MIKVEVDKRTMRSIEFKLGKLSSKAPTVMKKAINDTAKQARKQLAMEAQKQYSIKFGRFNKTMRIKNASIASPVAIIKTTGQSLEIMDFKASPNKYLTGDNKPDVIKGKVYRKGRLKNLQRGNLKSFIVKFKNGHVSVVQRVKKGSEPEKSKLGHRYIKKLLSPSIPTMLGNEAKVYGIVKPVIENNLKINLQKHIKMVLEG